MDLSGEVDKKNFSGLFAGRRGYRFDAVFKEAAFPEFLQPIK